MKAYLLSYKLVANRNLYYKLVYAFTYEQAKGILIKFLNVEESAVTITNETLEYTI